MKSKPLPSVEFINSWLIYDKTTGFFFWKKEPIKIGRKLIGKKAGTNCRNGVHITICRQSYLAHRLAWVVEHGALSTEIEIDHWDGNPLNNIMSNLRLATSTEQKQNKKVQRNNISGLKGAYYHACRKGKKWRSQIRLGKKLIFLGYFATPEEAHLAHRKAELELFGKFAYANRPKKP